MDLGLSHLLHYEIEEPKVRTMLVEVPYRDGNVDLIPYMYNAPVFQNRKITIRFETVEPRSTWPALMTNLHVKLSGRKTKVIFNTDIDYFYEGICTVGRLVDKGSTAEITITIDAFPYKKRVIAENKTIEFEYTAGGTDKVIDVGQQWGFVNTIGITATPDLPYGARVQILIDRNVQLLDVVAGGDAVTSAGLMIQPNAHTITAIVTGVSQPTAISATININGGLL